jgi:hypothetical protein
MRLGAGVALLALLFTAAACGGNNLFRQYEYEEEMYLSLDGSATIYVNSSLAALNALRGTSFDASPSARVDRDAVRAWFTSPNTHVTRVTQSRRRGRRFAHIRLDVDHVDRLSSVAPFAWSTYRLAKDGDLFVYQQAIGAASGKAAGDEGWTGDEIVAFRIHLPSRIVYHNAGPGNPRRGNILVWEQPLAARLQGEPLTLDARFESQSILSRTLLLFAASAALVALTFAFVIWRIMKRSPSS